jgi:hypothetical protein
MLFIEFSAVGEIDEIAGVLSLVYLKKIAPLG